jgi:hypothetical protein
LVRRIRQGAPGVGCSPAIMPSLSKRWMVDGATPSTTAAFLIVGSSPSGAQVVGFALDKPLGFGKGIDKPDPSRRKLDRLL